MMIAKTTMVTHRVTPRKSPPRPDMPYPPRRDRHRLLDRRGRHGRCDGHGGLTGEFAALGSLFTAGYLFLLIL